MGRIVIAVYRPKPGFATELESLVKTHVPILRSLGLATARESITMRAKNDMVIEVFEWVSKDAIESAHKNVTVLEMWQKFAEVCDFTTLSQVSESQQMFSEFTPLDQ